MRLLWIIGFYCFVEFLKYDSELRYFRSFLSFRVLFLGFFVYIFRECYEVVIERSGREEKEEEVFKIFKLKWFFLM